MEDSCLVFYQWQPEWDLPSFDANCLTFLTLMKFSKLEFSLLNCNNPAVSPSKRLPFLRKGNTLFSRDEEIINLCKSFGTLRSLASKEEIIYRVFKNLILNKIFIVMLYYAWKNEINYRKITWPLYSKFYVFPLNYWLPYKIKKRVLEFLDGRFSGYGEGDFLREVVEAFQTLSSFLAEKKFFFGDQPTELDAFVFGYLQVILKTPFMDERLSIILKDFSNLCHGTGSSR
jgi:hypothetical protein